MRPHHDHTAARHTVLGRALLVALLLLLIATTLGVARTTDPPAGGGGLPAAGHAAPSADTITPAMIALGDEVFHGRKGGALCVTCHGKGGRGVAGLGPDLTDATWLHGDGSLAFVTTIIRTGVMTPKGGGAVMPPYGGSPLKPDQLQAVAAYVYSLSHRTGG